MAGFTSARERRLWLWTLAVVAAIYATLGLAGTLAGVLRARGLLEAAFAVGALLVLAAVVAVGVRARPRGVGVAVALGVAAAYLLLFVRMATPEERTHIVEYGVVALLLHGALVERARNGRPVPAPAILAALATAVLGAVDEGIQWFLPTRVFDPRDLGFNALAGALAIGGAHALSRVRRG